MAKYSDIKGFTVQTLSTDTIASQLAGGAWASANSSNTNHQNAGGAGTQTAFLAFGGGPNKADTEEYDGTSWATRPSLATGRHTGAGGGTSASAFYAGGASPDKANTEEFTAETTADTAKTIDFD